VLRSFSRAVSRTRGSRPPPVRPSGGTGGTASRRGRGFSPRPPSRPRVLVVFPVVPAQSPPPRTDPLAETLFPFVPDKSRVSPSLSAGDPGNSARTRMPRDGGSGSRYRVENAFPPFHYRLPLLSGLLLGTSYIPFPPWALFLCLVPLWLFWLREGSVRKILWGVADPVPLLPHRLPLVAHTAHEFRAHAMAGGAGSSCCCFARSAPVFSSWRGCLRPAPGPLGSPGGPDAPSSLPHRACWRTVP